MPAAELTAFGHSSFHPPGCPVQRCSLQFSLWPVCFRVVAWRALRCWSWGPQTRVSSRWAASATRCQGECATGRFRRVTGMAASFGVATWCAPNAKCYGPLLCSHLALSCGRCEGRTGLVVGRMPYFEKVHLTESRINAEKLTLMFLFRCSSSDMSNPTLKLCCFCSLDISLLLCP
jgi:hypothetical protein